MCVGLCVEAPLLLLLLLVPGGLCSEWSVVFPKQRVCAVRNTTAVFHCSFTRPAHYTVAEVKWAHGNSTFFRGPFVFDSEERDSASRLRYIGDKSGNCSLKMQRVERSDAGHYAFRFITHPSEKFTSRDSLVLNVTDLEVLVVASGAGPVREGDSLTLTCRNACDGARAASSTSFTWWRNGLRAGSGAALGLKCVSPRDSGNYSCSLSGRPGTTSAAVHVNVEYGPKNTSVLGEMSVGLNQASTFRLTCSSQANPSVDGYTWFRLTGDQWVEAGNQSGLFSAVGGQFFCRASNKHGSQNSSSVTIGDGEITPLSEPKAPVVNTVVFFIVALLLLVIVTYAITWVMRKRRRCAAEGNPQNPVYANWWATEGHSQPRTGSNCDGAAPAELVYASVDYGPQETRQTRQQQEDRVDERTVYSTVSSAR